MIFSIISFFLQILFVGDNVKKKLLLLFVPILFLVGCEMGNTPKSRIENLMMKYQKLDGDIASGISNILDEQTMTDTQKDRYRSLIEKQYKNLSYEIKDERIDGNNAIVTVEIEVIDYKRAINDLLFDGTVYTKETYDDEKLNRLENASDKVTYSLDISLSKDEDGTWRINALTNEDIKKIQGMF